MGLSPAVTVRRPSRPGPEHRITVRLAVIRFAPASTRSPAAQPILLCNCPVRDALPGPRPPVMAPVSAPTVSAPTVSRNARNTRTSSRFQWIAGHRAVRNLAGQAVDRAASTAPRPLRVDTGRFGIATGHCPLSTACTPTGYARETGRRTRPCNTRSAPPRRSNSGRAPAPLNTGASRSPSVTRDRHWHIGFRRRGRSLPRRGYPNCALRSRDVGPRVLGPPVVLEDSRYPPHHAIRLPADHSP